ncbi:MAG TPA: hypothetical protein PK858_07610, partial [Saprospiraceae bacterium]|nr:hypothetical protein [Saprospiraceae bacterium]
MTVRLFRVISFCLLFSLARLTGAAAQAADLRADKDFFQKRKSDFDRWLRQNHLEGILRADSIGLTAQKATLYLRAAYRGKHVCDSLQSAWNKLEQSNRKVNGQYFHERLLHKWAFLAELHLDQAEVVVRCHNPAHFQARIFPKNGKIPVETRNVRAGAVLEVKTPASLQGINNGDNTALIA